MNDNANESTTLTAMSIAEILKSLPHRYPFLMIDKIIKIDGDETAVGIKNVTFNEPIFQGHFPENPIFPGVLIIEGMAQTAGAIVIKHDSGTGKKNIVLMLGVWFVMKKTKIGIVMRATQLDRETARAFGINVDRVYILAMVLSFATASWLLFGCSDGDKKPGAAATGTPSATPSESPPVPGQPPGATLEVSGASFPGGIGTHCWGGTCRAR